MSTHDRKGRRWLTPGAFRSHHRCDHAAGVCSHETSEPIAGDDQAAALAIVLEAAERWQNEILEYIIPDARTGLDDAAAYIAMADDIGAALEVLR